MAHENLPVVHVINGRQKKLLQGHPWVYGNEIERVEDEIVDGELKDGPNRVISGSVLCGRAIEENLCGVEYLKPFIYNGRVYLCPDIEIMPFGVFSAGVLMGEVRKGRLVPAHHLFSALGKNFKNKICLDVEDERLTDYINGYEITVPEAKNGFAVITVNGAPLGGVKVSSGACKNHYLK